VINGCNFFEVISMSFTIRILVISALTFLLSACQSAPKYHSFMDGNLKAHHLYLTYSKATFNEKMVTIEGGIRTITAPSNVECGYLSIEVFNQQGVLLNTIATTYSPCILHFRPRAKRTGLFSATLEGIEPQPLTIKVYYRKN